MIQTVRPTFRQRLLASDWVPFVFQLIGMLGFVALVVWKIRPSIDSLSLLVDLVAFVFAVVVAGLVGWLMSFLPMWLLLGPVVYHQSLLNGGPFAPGDVVMILAGPHRGRISRVYGIGQHGALKVEIGEEDRRQYMDSFPAYQLLRVTQKQENVTPTEDEPYQSTGQG